MTTLTEQQRAAFINAIAAVPLVTYACGEVGINRRDAYRERDIDPAFAAAWDEAQELGMARFERMAGKDPDASGKDR